MKSKRNSDIQSGEFFGANVNLLLLVIDIKVQRFWQAFFFHLYESNQKPMPVTGTEKHVIQQGETVKSHGNASAVE